MGTSSFGRFEATFRRIVPGGFVFVIKMGSNQKRIENVTGTPFASLTPLTPFECANTAGAPTWCKVRTPQEPGHIDRASAGNSRESGKRAD